MYACFFKRFIDFSIAFLFMLLFGWFLLIIAIWLHFANKGAGAFFFQERPGKDGKMFRICKFKSMTDERDAEGKLLPDRERLTSVGKFIRATSIDELPQLYNVLVGDMSIIGPRPLLARYLPYYTEREKLRHSVRPGITGWAQINGRNILGWDAKLEMDAFYAEHVTFLFDVKILLLTIYKVVKREGNIPDKKENFLDVERSQKLSFSNSLRS